MFHMINTSFNPYHIELTLSIGTFLVWYPIFSSQIHILQCSRHGDGIGSREPEKNEKSSDEANKKHGRRRRVGFWIRTRIGTWKMENFIEK